jgi:hypothetical protein
MSYERVARSEDVAAPRFLRVEVQRRPLLLTRLSDGGVAAFDPICPHQHNPMDAGSTTTPTTPEPGPTSSPQRAARVLGLPVFEVMEKDGWVLVGPRRVVPDVTDRDEGAA